MSRLSVPLGVPIVRFAHSMAFIKFLGSSGAPHGRYLEANKLPTLCEEPDSLIPVARMYGFLAIAARREEQFLGWLVGESFGDKQFSAEMQQSLAMAPSLFIALKNLVALGNCETSDIELCLRERERDIILCMRYKEMRGVPGYGVAQAYQLSVFMSIVQMFLGKNWVPEEIGLECQRSRDELPEKLRAARFVPQHPFGYFTVRKSCLPHSQAEGAGGIAATMPASGLDQLDDLQLLHRLLRAYIPDGYVPQAFAAELLETSVRSLTRRLSGHGTTYQRLMDSVRFQAAKEHLANRDMRIIDVAHAVGFNDQGDFTRLFRRVGGVTPANFRRTVLGAM